MIRLVCLIVFLSFFSSWANAQDCVNMWDADPPSASVSICTVSTLSGYDCQFPFTYNGVNNYNCIVDASNLNPRCMTTNGQMSICNVPNSAVITYVTTVKGGAYWQNGASLNGGTMLWIYGQGFAANLFSTSPTSTTSNEVILVGNFASYSCEIHPDKTTNTQITCYTPPMDAGNYLVRVRVNGLFVPYYQYTTIGYADIQVNGAYTPKITDIQPSSAIPGSFVTINGDFKSVCLAMDDSFNYDNKSCSLDTTPRILRVYFGGQPCQLMDPATSALYYNLTVNLMTCQLNKAEINYYNASILVSTQYGRSLTSQNKFYVSPNDRLYNFQTFAEINSVSPKTGSTIGGTFLTITGKYFFDSSQVPSTIKVGDQPCQLVSFDMSNLPETTLVCQTPNAPSSASTEYYGNRGVNIIRDNVYTSFNSLAAAIPSAQASQSVNRDTNFTDTQSVDVTIWMKGFISPQKDSLYEFSIVTNGEAALYISTDATSANKNLIASTQSTLFGSVQLQANNSYYFLAVASKQSGSLNFLINAKMFDTSLTNQVTSYVFNEQQQIIITSTVVSESYSISAATKNVPNPKPEIQTLLVESDLIGTEFLLKFGGVTSTVLYAGVSASDVQKALNDMPTLSPNLVTVTESFSDDGVSKIYTVTFSSELGNVDLIEEVLGLVNFTASETQVGVASENQLQLTINDQRTSLINTSDSNSLGKTLDESFGIRCPYSILNGNDVLQALDFESSSFTTDFLNKTVFCGQNSLSNYLVWYFNNINSRYICFAYNSDGPITQISVYLYDIITKNKTKVSYAYAGIGDSQWHFNCTDLVSTFGSKLYPSSSRIYQAAISLTSAKNFYFDAVTLRNSVPLGYQDGILSTTRRLYPSLQILPGSLTVSSLTAFSFKPVMCQFNLNPIAFSQSYTSFRISRTSNASPPVQGTYDLNWYDTVITGIPGDSTAENLKILLQAQPGLGLVDVVRTKDCYGYTYAINWLSGGNKPNLTVNNSTGMTGNDVVITTKPIQDGYAVFSPIKDDMIRTVHAKPQITISINNIMSKCSGSCDFEWASSATPVITNIDTSNMQAIVLTGTGFDINPKNDIVKIGDVSCTVNQATATRLVCSAGENSVGTYQFSVNILGKGNAILNSNPIVQFTMNAESLTPQTIGTGGGALLRINGTGFNLNCTVQVDGINCPISYVDYHLIMCTIPSNPTQADKTVDVVVSLGALTSTISQQLTYVYATTAIINSIDPPKLSVLGGQEITLTGINFPLNPDNVKIGDQIVYVISASSTQLKVKSPALAPGQYDISLPSENLGVALSSVKAEYELSVSSFTPNIGSIRGGTIVEISGAGFSTNCSLNSVSFGPVGCSVLDCSASWIKCKTSNSYSAYKIDNSASDPYYGQGYAWSKPYLVINKGDSVNWSWKPPTGVTGVKYQIVQVKDAKSYVPTGFNSGDPTATGSFQYQFNEAGSYFYWSGYVEDSEQITFRGIVVVQDSVDKQFRITVKLNNFIVTNTSDISITPTISNTCSNIDATSCGVSAPSSDFSFLFTTCRTTSPSITSVNTGPNTLRSEITIQGSGFASSNCNSKVYIGGVECPLTGNNTDTQLVCKLSDSNTDILPNKLYEIEVLIPNYGNALQVSTFQLNLNSVITSIDITTGSVKGGTKITIQGAGFSQYAYVQFGDVPYYYFYNGDANNTQITFNSIVIYTSPMLNGVYDIKVNTDGVQPVCLASTCKFTFSDAITPIIQSVSPTTISGSGTVTLSGTHFGNDLSKISINVGKQFCVAASVSDTQITCQLAGLNLGSQSVTLNVLGVGYSKSTIATISGVQSISTISPSSGSVNGGTIISIAGNGFDSSTRVLIDTTPCKIINYTINTLNCLSGSHVAAANLNFQISTNGVSYTTGSFKYAYDIAKSPVVSSVTPPNGSSGSLTISGSGFGSDSSVVNVLIGKSLCSITSITDTQIVCTINSNSAGFYPVVVQIDNNGYSNNDKTFKFDLSISSLSSSTGSIGGGLSLNISGQGFSSNITVKICNQVCNLTDSSLTLLTCLAPPSSNQLADTTCDLIVSENGQQTTQQAAFTYLNSLSPKLSSVSPIRGGTGGGTSITIYGTLIPQEIDKTLFTVMIAGSQCDVTRVTSTQIECTTNGYLYSSVRAPIQVFIEGRGYALNNGSVQYQYIDLWSSPWTWGGGPVPGDGELVVIGNNQIIYFDAATTPVLKGVIIQGGSLIFDDSQDVSLNVEYIVITDGGKLQVGNKQAPFQHKAVITMHGSVRSVELPIFGSKVIGVRNGTIDLHGLPVGVTWTYLGTSASAGDNTITLKEPVIWQLGAQIAIATTGDKFSPGQTEVRFIQSKSTDNLTLTLDKPLKYNHLSEKRTVGNSTYSVEVNIRAEVGLLSRNVIFQGHNDDSWTPFLSAPACPDGFDPSEFAVQTCFLGRYGPEIGIDQFGGTIMLSGEMRKPGSPESVIGRFSNVEFFHVGQAYRLGRYPIHFHMNGDMPSSFVSECAIHESFNRATNIHASNYITIERNVIYDIMGGAYFLEDGIEIGNKFLYNLALFVKPSSSGLNEDTTPAAFWATNPNNTYMHNNVAGTSHFGIWYRLLTHPDGPSYNTNYYPNRQPFGVFYNNTVHSTGRFGVWVFPSYAPTSTGLPNAVAKVAVFKNLVSYNNDKGAEFVDANNVQFRNFLIWDQYSVAIETKTIIYNQDMNTYQKNTLYLDSLGPVVGDSIVIGNSLNSESNSITPSGVVIAWDRGELFSNITFINFPSSHAFRATRIEHRCTDQCGGWTTQFKGLKFINVQYRTYHRWQGDYVAVDLDGSLTDSPINATVVYADDINKYDPLCKLDARFLNGVVCSKTTNRIRFAITNFPEASVTMTNNRNLTSQSHFSCFRLTQVGNMFTMEVNQTYSYSWYNRNLMSAIDVNFPAAFYGLKQNEWVIIQHPFAGRKPDLVYLINGAKAIESSTALSPATNNNGDWYWDDTTKVLSYLIKNANTKPFLDVSVRYSAKYCQFPGCITPSGTVVSNNNTVSQRPANALFWSNLTTWSKIARLGWGGYLGVNQTSLPKDYDRVLIPNGYFVVVDCPLPKLKHLQIDGALEFDNGRDHYLEVDIILINGGQMIVGWENDPILTNVQIVLTGRLSTTSMNNLTQGFELVKAKGIGVFGSLDIHGAPKKVTWTTLAQTLVAGSNKIKLSEPVDWKVNDQIAITTTTYAESQSELLDITAISADNLTLTLKQNAKYTHLAYSETLSNGAQYEIAAGVGLISHNVKIIGEDYPTVDSDQFGSRIVVSGYYYFSNSSSYSYFKGSFKVSNAQFTHLGQMGDTMNCIIGGIQMINLGPSNELGSYIVNSAFNNGYQCALGIKESGSIPVENNIFYHFGDKMTPPIFINNQSNIFKNNLFMSTKATRMRFMYDSIIMEDNLFAGAALFFKGDVCPNGQQLNPNYNQSITRNSIYGSKLGAVLDGVDFTYATYGFDCVKISGFTIFRTSLAAVLYKDSSSVLVDSNILIDNQVNVYTYVLQPSSVDHIAGNKTSQVQNNLIVGQTPVFSCQDDDPLIQVFIFDFIFIGAGPNYDSKVGVVWPQFANKFTLLWSKGWAELNAYNQISGLMIVKNVTFAHFVTNCKGSKDAAIATSPFNDDLQHPITLQNITLIDVLNESKVWIHRPNQASINPNQCIDMDCDGLKKNLLTDLDGSFLGSPGNVFSQSEYQWGSQARGLGDFRIPKELLSLPNGTYNSPSNVYKYPGIVRDENLCKYVSPWQAYECHGLDYRMLIIESMDNDTESRRLSPVAILSDNKYLDLINGPPFHDWCGGYICQRRISTFAALIAANKSYDIYLTSTPPSQLRFRILNADASFKVRLSMYYFTSQRIDLYLNDVFVNATNAVNANGRMVIEDPSSDVASYMPTYMNKSGTNLYYKPDQRIYFSMDGSSVIDLKIAPVLYVRFGVPAITPAQFFNPQTLVGNFALLLGIDPAKIRKVNIIRASQSGKKKRQSSDQIFVELVIYDDPPTSANNSQASSNVQSSLSAISDKVSNQFMTGELQKQAQTLLNVTISSLVATPPVTNLTQKTEAVAVIKIAKIVVVRNADQCRASIPCLVQPVIKVLDNFGNIVKNVQWTIEARIDGSYDASILYQTEAKVVDGYANFTNLALSAEGSNFVITYNFKLPSGINASYFDPMNINADPVAASKPEFTCANSDSQTTVVQNELFNLKINIIDSKYQADIQWNLTNYTWQAEVRMYKLGYYQGKGSLDISKASVLFDPTNGYTLLNNLAINNAGMYLLSINMFTSDNKFSTKCYTNTITVLREAKNNTNANQTANYKLKFKGDYYNLSQSDKNEIMANVYNYISDYNISVSNITLYPGSVYVAFYSSDSNNALIKALLTSGLNISSLIVFDSASINGISYGSSSSASSNTNNTTGAIVGGVIGGLALITILVFLFLGFKEFKKFNFNVTRIRVSPDIRKNWMDESQRESRETTFYNKYVDEKNEIRLLNRTPMNENL